MPVLMIMGLISLLLGVVLFFVWFGYILALIKAVLPLAFIIGGAVGGYLGWEELKEKRGPTIDFSSPDEANRYKAEAKAYQAELNEIRVAPPSVIETEPQSNEPIINAEQIETLTGSEESK